MHCVLRIAYCAQETSGCGTEGSCPKGAVGQAVHCVLSIALCIAASGSMLWAGLRIAHCVCVLRIGGCQEVVGWAAYCVLRMCIAYRGCGIACVLRIAYVYCVSEAAGGCNTQ